MRNWISALLYLCIAVCSTVHADALQDHLQRADESYRDGETADTIAAREQAFNRALTLYSRLEDEPGNGKLFYNIGNTYYQLGEYGWAILYYLKGLQLLPRDDLLRFHLSLAQAEQGLPVEAINPVTDKLLFWHRLLAQHEKIYLALSLLALAVLLTSLWIWIPIDSLKVASTLVSIATGAVVLSVVYSQYFAPVQAVVVQSFGLYHGPSEEAALVEDVPFIPGTAVNVIEATEDGSWLKIYSPQGKTGYLPADVTRII